MFGKKHKPKQQSAFDAATGFSLGHDFAKSLSFPGQELIRQSKITLRRNFELEDEIQNGDWQTVLRLWHLEAETVPEYMRYKKREMWAGLGLTLFAGLATLTQYCFPPTSSLVFVCTSIAMLSMFCCGLCMSLAAAWRVSVCKQQRFTPFLTWLKHLFV